MPPPLPPSQGVVRSVQVKGPLPGPHCHYTCIMCLLVVENGLTRKFARYLVPLDEKKKKSVLDNLYLLIYFQSFSSFSFKTPTLNIFVSSSCSSKTSIPPPPPLSLTPNSLYPKGEKVRVVLEQYGNTSLIIPLKSPDYRYRINNNIYRHRGSISPLPLSLHVQQPPSSPLHRYRPLPPFP